MEFRASYISSRESVRVARRAVLSFARDGGVHGLVLQDLEHAVGEALANAAEHGHVDGARFEVYARFDDGALAVEVKDDGPGFAGWNDARFERPKSDAPRGLGIVIMRKLMDRVEYSDGGSRIRLIRRIGPASVEGTRLEA